MDEIEFLYEHGDGVEAAKFIDVPRWIMEMDSTIYGSQIASIIEGGVESGAFMPAVTYHTALAVMGEHGDDVLDYIEESIGEIPSIPDDKNSWSGMAVFFLSTATELWASNVAEELMEAMEEAGYGD